MNALLENNESHLYYVDLYDEIRNSLDLINHKKIWKNICEKKFPLNKDNDNLIRKIMTETKKRILFL